MSSSFVKDCSDVSAPGNTASGKTVIIIVNNETGNVSLDGNELQNLLASHGADGSQVSVVRMGSGATVNLTEAAQGTVTTTVDGAQHVNLTVEGYPSIPVEGQVGGTGSYAELPLDADAFRRLESVLESEEAREILGKPLLDMVANPEHLGPLEDLMDPSLFEGESQSTAPSGHTLLSSGTAVRKNQSPPKRRSQRQMDKAEREEVEKILAENHKKMQEEREQLSGHQIVLPFPQTATPTFISLQGACQDGLLVATDGEVVRGSEENEVEGSNMRGIDAAPVRGKGRPRGKGRGKVRGDGDRPGPPETKGRGRGKKMADADGEKGVRGEEAGRGRPRGKGRGKAIAVVTTTTSAPTVTDLVQDTSGQGMDSAGGKKCKVIVRKKKSVDSSVNEGKVVTTVEGQNEAEAVPEDTEASAAETQEQVAKKPAKKAPPTPKVIPQFEPALFSTPDVMQKVGEGGPTQAIMVKGNGKSIKAQKILLVKKQMKKEKVLFPIKQEKEEKPDFPIVPEGEEASATDVNNSVDLKMKQEIKTEADEEETKSGIGVGEAGILSSVSTVMKQRVRLGEGKSHVIQVSCPTDVREVVVLNSARTGMNRETLVKVIPPKDPPKEEEKTPVKQKVLKKEGKQQVKKISPPTPAVSTTAPTEAATTTAALEEEQGKADVANETAAKEPKKKLFKKFRPDGQKGGELHKSYEDIVLLRKREEAQRKKEEIQRRREEILRKREAIKKRKEMREQELKEAKKEEVLKEAKKEEVTNNTPAKETPAKVIKVPNKVVMVKKNIEDKKKNGIQVAAVTPGNKQAPSTPQPTTIKVIRKVVPKNPAAAPPHDESPIRRSNRPIKKKTFGDEMLTYDLKEVLAPESKEEDDDETVDEEMILTQEDDEEDESMEEDVEDDDPERLWCICQKPHNNRFMICCDRCEDWFHGTCVGVTKAIGQQMEQEGKEWVCPKCKKTERAMKGVVTVLGGKRMEGHLSSPVTKIPQSPLSPTKVVKQIIINKPDEPEKKPAEVKKPPDGVKRLGGLSGFTIPKKVNITHEAITPPKKILGDEKRATPPQVIKVSQKKEHVIQPRFWQKVQESARGVGSLEKSKPKVLVYHKPTGKIISGAEAPTFDELKDWLREHPDCGILQPGMMNASGTLVSQGATVAASPNSQKKVIQLAKPPVPVSSPLSQKVTVVKSPDGRVIVKTSENLEREALTKVVNTVTSQPTAKTVIVSSAKAAAPLVKEVEEKKDVSPAKKEEPSQPLKTPAKDPKKPPKQPQSLPASEKKKADNAEVRSNVKKTLADCLAKRCEETKDEFPNVTEEYIKGLVSDIEKELYLHFGKDVGMKYKTRYRSILFNTKDSKNSGLFRKILKGTISPSQLAKMTSEELASKELLEWREREEKKELQAIEKHELEMIALGNQYIMKSHKGEIEIDKDEFIKEKEKAPDTLSSLPIDPMTEILDDTTANHSSHIYDLNCKICNGQQEPPAVTLQDSKSHKDKSKEKSRHKSISREHKGDEPANVKDRKERKSSSDRDRRDRKDSTDKDRHRHRSKDHKEKSRDRDKDKDRHRDRDKEKDRDRDKDKDKHRSKSKHSDDSKDKPRDRERHKSSSSSISNDKDKDRDKERERRDSKDKRDDKDRRHKDKYRDRRDSKDDKSSNKRRDSEKDDKREGRKRRHSESRSEDKKRRESEKENTRHREADEKQKDEVSTSDDVVFDVTGGERSSSSSSIPDGYMRDAEPSSTVIGSPENTNIMEPASPTSDDEMLHLAHDTAPPLPPTSPGAVPPPPAEAYSPSSPLNSEKSSPRPPHDRDTFTPPPLPDDEMPAAPPLPDYDIPCTPPPPDEYNPQTPPMPGAFSQFRGYRLSPPMERSTTPPLPEPSSTPPLPQSPGTPPLPMSGGSTPTLIGASSTPPHTPRGATPPLPREKPSGSVPSYMPSSPTLLDYSKNLGRLTPPIGSDSPAGPTKSSGPVLITPEPENVWQGIIHMPDVAKFSASAFEVSGKAKFLPNDVPNMIEVVGRIAPDMVWSYIAQMKKSGSKEILVVRFQPANEEEKVSYIALYSYLSSKKRYAVIGNCGKSVKDFYIVPLASHQTIPQALLPLNGPGFEEQRAHMLIGVIVRAKSKRVFDHTTGNWKVVSGGQTVPSHKISDADRSCTPPLPTDEDIQEIALAAKEAEDFDLENDLPVYREPRPLKRRAKNAGESSQSKKRREQSSDSNSPAIGEEPKSPPEDSYVEASLDQESMLAELNRQIEEHKKELSEMQKTIGNDEDEPYSPSHADDSPSNEGEQLKLDTSKINIPSNLQEILDNIREKEAEIKQKEQEIKRRLSLTSDPIVMTYGKYQTYEKKKGKEASTPGKDVDLRTILHSQSKPNKETKTDTDLRVLKTTTEENKPSKVAPATKQEEDVDLRIRDPRLARAQASAASTASAVAAVPPPPATDSSEKSKTLSKMTDEELLAKALEMEDSQSSSRQAAPEGGVESQFHPVMPVPPPFIPPGMPGGFIPPGGAMVGPDTLAGPLPPPPVPPVPPPFLGSMGLPAVDMYGSQGSRLGGPHGPQGYVGPDSGTLGSSGYSGAPGSTRPRYPDQAWEAGQGYSGRGWGHGYPDRDRERDWDRDRDCYREWNREWERDRDREMHARREPGHSRYQYKGRRHDKKGKRKEKREKEKAAAAAKQPEPNEEDVSYPEIDY